jgi:hypothetical protein
MQKPTIMSYCQACNQPIRLGDPVKVKWNGERDEHINCPVPDTIGNFEDKEELCIA